MILLAIVLILAAAALALFMVFGVSHNQVGVKIDGLGLSLDSSPLTIYVLGAVTMLLLGLGWAMLRHGSRRKLESRRELKRLRKAEREQDHTVGANHTMGSNGPAPMNAGNTRPGPDVMDARGTGETYVENQRRL